MSLEIVDARVDKTLRAWLESAHSDYLAELSLTEQGRLNMEAWLEIEPDPVDFWLTDHNARVFVFVKDGERAGFAMVCRKPFPYMLAGMDNKIGDFYVVPSFRGKSVGAEAAKAIFDMFQGRWEVNEFPENTGGIAFWQKVIGDYTEGVFKFERFKDLIRQSFYA